MPTQRSRDGIFPVPIPVYFPLCSPVHELTFDKANPVTQHNLLKTYIMKAFLSVLAAIVFFAVMFIYYGTSNIKVPVKNLRNEIAGLINSSSREFNREYLDRSEEIKRSLNNNSLVGPGLKSLYQKDFIDAWQNNKKLNKDTISMLQKRNNQLFAPILRSLDGAQDYQLTCCITISLLFSLFLFLAVFTNLLRDIVGDNTALNMRRAAMATAEQRNNVNAPYSLARTQLAIWITVISSLYLHAILWNQCKLDVGINITALILMGISAGTFATGAILDTIEIEQGLPRSQDQPASKFFLRDILSDKNGISIHRFQNVIWTVIALLVYFYRYNHKAIGADCLPELDATLLALTGISSATYLTLKTRENTPAKNEVKVHLEPSSSAPADILSHIQSGGLSNTTLTVNDNTGTLVKTIKGSDSAGSFIIDNLVPGNYRLNAVWKANINGQEKQLTGTYNGAVDNKITVPIILA